MPTTHFVPGAPNWIDIGTPDTDATTAFYTGLFGWQLDRDVPDPETYALFRLEGKVAGGLGTITEARPSSTWRVYFHTTDADATAKAVEQAGGAVRFGPRDVFTEGRMAGFTDPTGAEFSVWQPRDTPGLGVVFKPGSLIWVELYTDDPDAARSFYSTVFGWKAEAMTFPGGTYTVLSPAESEGERPGFGGIVPSTYGGAPRWLPYFMVNECDTVVAKAQELGGNVEMPAADMEGVGRLARLSDSFGAEFALITPSPPEAA